MTTTKIKPVVGGAFANATLDTQGRVLNTDATLAALPPGSLLQAMAAVNEWHNAPANAVSSVRAQSTANAAGITLEDV